LISFCSTCGNFWSIPPGWPHRPSGAAAGAGPCASLAEAERDRRPREGRNGRVAPPRPAAAEPPSRSRPAPLAREKERAVAVLLRAGGGPANDPRGVGRLTCLPLHASNGPARDAPNSLPAQRRGHLARAEPQPGPQPNARHTLILGLAACLLQKRSQPFDGSFRHRRKSPHRAPPY
jgi:hypothetical protein